MDLGIPQPIHCLWPNNQKPSRAQQRNRRAASRYRTQQMTDFTQEEVFTEVRNNEENLPSYEADNDVSTTDEDVVSDEVVNSSSYNCLQSPDSFSSQNKSSFNCDNCGVDYSSQQALEDH